MTVQASHRRLAKQAEGARPVGADSLLTLAIENMHCGGCMRSVERAALGVRGVETARASLPPSGSASLTTPILPARWISLPRSNVPASLRADRGRQAGSRDRAAELSVAARGGRGLRRHEHHAAVGRRLVGDGERHGGAARGAVPLAVGDDRAAHSRLCRAAVFRLGARRAQGPAA